MPNQDSPRTAYQVRKPLDSRTDRPVHQAVEAKVLPRRSAVFVAHGMGQQIPFQTLDQIALGLRRQDLRWNEKEPDLVPGVAQTVENEPGKPFQRLELKLESPRGVAHEVHVYEAYWAPLTEGNVSLRDTIRFLLEGGFNGLANLRGTFKRWLFSEYQSFSIPAHTIFYLLVAVAVVAALIVLNTTIGLVAAARSVLTSQPVWLSNSLFADLTTTFNFVVFWMILFVMCLVIAKGLRRLKPAAKNSTSVSKADQPVAKEARKEQPNAVSTSSKYWATMKKRLQTLWNPMLSKTHTVVSRLWGAVTVLFFVSTLFVTIGAGGAVPVLLYGHLQDKSGAGGEIWKSLLDPNRVEVFNHGFDEVTFWLLALAVIGLLGWSGLRLLLSVLREVWEDRQGRRWTLLVAAAFGVIVAGLAFEGWALWYHFQDTSNVSPLAIALRGLSWPILLIASGLIRKFLVQYPGDVAAYVTSNTLDRFYKLRQEIKEAARSALLAVYQRRERDGRRYDQVIVVGHSLGSVIVYDVLNALINEDMLNGGPLNVVDRTPLLVTYGSPLDKLAFLFALQKNKTDEAREALAASVQPLLQSYDLRPKRWVNIYSPWDIIGGKLIFFDLPGLEYSKKNLQAVENCVDPDATTLLAAHTEYGENPLLYQTIFKQVTS